MQALFQDVGSSRRDSWREEGQLVGGKLSMTHDPIADMLTRLRNAGMAKHEKVEMPFSKSKERILAVLKDCLLYTSRCV